MNDWTPLITFILGIVLMGFLSMVFVVGTFSGTKDECLSSLYAPIKSALSI